MDLKQLEQEIDKLKEIVVNLKNEKVKFEAEVPDDIENYYIMGYTGYADTVKDFPEATLKRSYIRGLIFETKEEAEQFDKERILLFKLHKWAEEQNEGWTPDWDKTSEPKYCVEYNNYTREFTSGYYSGIFTFSKLPHFKSEEIAEQFIDEFGDEIKEVLL